MWKCGKMGQSYEMAVVRKLSFRESNYFLMQSLSILKINLIWYRNARGIVILLTCFCLFALCTFFLYKNHYFIDKTTVNLFFSVNVLICFCKGFDMIVFSKSFNRIIIFFEEKMCSITDDKSIFIKFDKYMTMSKLWACRIFTLNFIVLSISLAFPLINVYITQNLSLPIGNSYQLTESYAFEFVFQSIGYVCSALVSSTFGALYICCCIFITYQLDVLVYEISSLKLKRNYNEYAVKSKLARLIENHVLIIHANSLTNSAFGYILFMQIFVSTICICFAMLHIQNMNILFVVPGQLVEIVMFCYFGQKLHDKSCELADAFYATPWVDMRVPERKLILTALRQAQRPLFSRAGPLRTLTHDSLKVVFQTAYSFYAVLSEFDS